MFWIQLKLPHSCMVESHHDVRGLQYLAVKDERALSITWLSEIWKGNVS